MCRFESWVYCQRQGQSAQGSDQDDVIFIPFTTAERKLVGYTVSWDRRRNLCVPPAGLTICPRRWRNPRGVTGAPSTPADQADDFTIRTQVDIGKVQEGASETLTVMMFAIASISLLVGGIGIMNILLVSVTERTTEIGVRMAVGAKRRHILMQFLIEAMTLGLLGGIFGIMCWGRRSAGDDVQWQVGRPLLLRALLWSPPSSPWRRPLLRSLPSQQSVAAQSYRCAFEI